jgi:hypothetical protein
MASANASLSLFKKSKINEEGDQPTAFHSPNDGMEPIPEYDCESENLDKLTELSRSITSQKMLRPLPGVTRSDFSSDWRKPDPVTKFIPNEIMPKFGPMSVLHKTPILTGPNEQKVKALTDLTGYGLTITARQRTYGPPPGWTGPKPGNECQVFFGKMPKQIFEDKLVPLFGKAGQIYEMRIMMEGAPSVISRGFGFVLYTSEKHAKAAEKLLNGYEILHNYFITVALSPPIRRLYICKIPKALPDGVVQKELREKLENVVSVEYKPSKGVCFVTFTDHLSAAQAKKSIHNNTIRLFRVKVTVDFADQIPEPTEQTMSEVKAVYVTGFKAWINQQDLEREFASCGQIERAKMCGTYAFIHFTERSAAERAIRKYNGQRDQHLGGGLLKVSLAYPQLSPEQKEEARIRREKRLENQRKESISRIIPALSSGLPREISPTE